MNERSGVVNIGIEGMMLSSAFTAFLVAGPRRPGDADRWPRADLRGDAPRSSSGVVAAIAIGMLVSLLHAWLSISIRADQIISGTIINILALGLTGYLNRLIITPNPRLGAGIFQPLDATDCADRPAARRLDLQGVLRPGPDRDARSCSSSSFLQIWLFRSRWGLRTRAVGEHPKAAETVGIDVIRLRYRNVILGGIFAGLAGAYLTLEQSGSFQNGMTSGRGFIALAAVIFGRWTPLGAFGAALLFTASEALRVAISLTPPTGQLGRRPAGHPGRVLSGRCRTSSRSSSWSAAVGRSVPPAAVGQPYAREART